jgi:hypothetical protein
MRQLAKMSHGPYKKTPSYGELRSLRSGKYGGEDPAGLADENRDIATAEELALGVRGCRRKSGDSRASFEPVFACRQKISHRCSENSVKRIRGKLGLVLAEH